MVNSDGEQWKIMVIIMVNDAYPLVNVYVTNWKDPPFSMGKSTISFSIANC